MTTLITMSTRIMLVQDYTCYEKAWELSKHKSARAQKSLGLYYLSKDKV